uniref:LolToxC n=1 Tax=Bichromomyia olmeca TaxID=715919 RepID=A0A1B1V3G5_9DIPT|nr:LolToxC [Bichromomyia olmeca]
MSLKFSIWFLVLVVFTAWVLEDTQVLAIQRKANCRWWLGPCFENEDCCDHLFCTPDLLCAWDGSIG